MSHAIFTCPDLTTFTCLDEFGREVVGQYLEPSRAVLGCRVVDDDQWCRRWPDRVKGRTLMQAVIDAIVIGVPGPLEEVIVLGRTLKKRAADILAYVDRPGTSNGPTEALNGRLEHLRGSALGFRNLTHYIAAHSWRPADSDPSTP